MPTSVEWRYVGWLQAAGEVGITSQVGDASASGRDAAL